jgi:hypothetical protein
MLSQEGRWGAAAQGWGGLVGQQLIPMEGMYVVSWSCWMQVHTDCNDGVNLVVEVLPDGCTGPLETSPQQAGTGKRTGG